MINEAQVNQLKNQVLAYKYLIRNQNIPKETESAMFSMEPDQWLEEKKKLEQESLKEFKEKKGKYESVKNLFVKRLREHREPIDLPSCQRIMIESRKETLKKLLEEPYELTHPERVQLQIERKTLELKDTLQQIKEEIFGNLSSIYTKYPKRTFEKAYLERSFFKREKPKNKSEERMIEKFEAHLHHEQETRKKIKHKEFLTKLTKHAEEFLEFHGRKYKTLKKVATKSKNIRETAEKRLQELREKEDRERIKALKEQNLEEYSALVQKTKNKKIMEILSTTETFLKQIAHRVRSQKGETFEEEEESETRRERRSDGQGGENLEEFNVAFSTLDSSYYNKIYYDLTHSNKEEVKDQPLILEGGQLKSYQLAGLSWMVSLYNNRLNGILADEMGLGKTIQTIALFAYLIEVKKNFGPFLVVVPLTTLPNWTMEFSKWAPALQKIVYKGSPPERKLKQQEFKNTKWNVCLTTYEYVIKDRLVLNKIPWQYIVVDEGHRMKNSQSKFAQILGQSYSSEHRLLLTGTPLQNNLPELWSLLNFLLPKVFENCDDFDKWFSVPLNKVSTEQDSVLNEEEKLLLVNRMHQVLRPFLLRRVKIEVESELPSKVEHVIKVELSKWQSIVYKRLQETGSLVSDPGSGKSGSKSFQNMIMQLRKICNHPYLFLDYYTIGDDLIWRTSGKFELLDRVLPKFIRFGHRILIFTQMTALLDIMEIFLEQRGHRFLRLDGSTKSEERGTRMELFNKANSDFSIFLLSTRAGGLGLNLQSADTVILFDSDWNPQMDLQAQDRAHRIGQKSEVRVYRFITNTWIEEEILSKAAYKMSLDEVFIQAGLYNQKATDTERKERLEEFLKRKSMTEDLMSGIPSDEQLNEILARDENELRVFNEMDRERYEQEKHIYKHFKHPAHHGKGETFNYRLVQEYEVPEWVKENAKTDNGDKKDENYGRGNRVRKQISYMDDLNDDEYFQRITPGKPVGLGDSSNTSKNTKGRGRPKRNQPMEEESSLADKRESERSSPERSNEGAMDEEIYQDEDGSDAQISDSRGEPVSLLLLTSTLLVVGAVCGGIR